MAEQESEALELREISPDDKVSGLSLGDKAFLPLVMFLKKDARSHHQENVSKTYVFANGVTKKVVAYITLICSQIELDRPLTGLDAYRHPYPAIKIAKLAVNTEHRKQQLGRKLVSLAIAIAKGKVLPHVGCRFLAVDSHPLAIDFYDRCGFRLLETDTNRASKNPVMFLDLGKLK